MIYLLDSNVLISRAILEHPHHEMAVRWLDGHPDFAVCPVTQGTLARYIFRTFLDSSRRVIQEFEAMSAFPGYEFWPDDVSYADVDFGPLQGQKQVTDAYLVALAVAHGGRLATFDRALVAVHPEIVLVPT